MLSRTKTFALLSAAMASGLVACSLYEPQPAQSTHATYQQSNLGICDGSLLASAEVIFVKGQNRLTQSALSWGSSSEKTLHRVTRTAWDSDPVYSGHLYKGRKLHPGATIEVGESGFVSLLVGEDRRYVNLQPNTKTFLQCVAHPPVARLDLGSPGATPPPKLSRRAVHAYLSAAERG